MSIRSVARPFVVAALVLPVAAKLPAEVAQAGPGGFLVRHEARIAAPPERVWEALVGEIGSWWDGDHTFSGDSTNLRIDPRVGGCMCERLPDGGGVEHLRVVHVAPGRQLRMLGALGPLQGSGLAASLTWELAAAGEGEAKETVLALRYSVGGFLEVGFETFAPAVDRVLGEQVDRLAAWVETGDPVRPAETPGE